MQYKVAVVGATGNVGREMLSVLAERAFPCSEVVALASSRSVGTEVSFGDDILKVKALEHYDFKGTDIVLMSAGGTVSKEWSPKIAAQGAIVIDNSSRLAHGPRRAADRAGSERRRARDGIKKGIIANPNCSTAQLVVALKPLHDRSQDQARRRRDLSIRVGRRQGCDGRTVPPDARGVRRRSDRDVEYFPKQIAFNVIPQIDVFLDSGYTKEEWKMMVETQKILDPDIQLTATCVRVPVFIGHSEAVNDRIREADHRGTGARDPARGAGRASSSTSARTAATSRRSNAPARTRPIVCRIRKDPTVEHGLSHVGRGGQSAQGCGAQRRADRRMPDQPQAPEKGA